MYAIAEFADHNITVHRVSRALRQHISVADAAIHGVVHHTVPFSKATSLLENVHLAIIWVRAFVRHSAIITLEPILERHEVLWRAIAQGRRVELVATVITQTTHIYDLHDVVNGILERITFIQRSCSILAEYGFLRKISTVARLDNTTSGGLNS